MAPVTRFTLTAALAGLALAAPVEKRNLGLRKRGVAYTDSSVVGLFNAPNADTWAYNWGSSAGDIPSTFEYVPLLWGPASEFTGPWSANANAAIGSGSSALMFYNEPDMPTQSNVSPEQAAADFMTYMMPFAGQVQLGAPAVSNSILPGEGLNWLQSFLDACTECQIDFVNVHWYNVADQNQNFMDQVTQANQMSGKPVWITEFGLNPGSSESDINSFLTDVIPWLAQQDFVDRYSYYYAGEGYLTSGNALSATGTLYNTLAI